MFKEGYSLKDISIIPAECSDIDHRTDVDPYITICTRKVLPIFVAPMASVTDEFNYNIWIHNNVTPVVPRTVDYNSRLYISNYTFVSMSLSEAEEFANSYKFNSIESKKYICIDIANGNMNKMFRIAKQIKNNFGDNVELMSGNIANPNTYKKYCEIGIDWVRVGIGGGSRCTTSCATGIHYPIASLLYEINEVKKNISGFKTKIIADGGINWYDDINKALALGADSVMMGKMFAECEEACSEIRYALNEKLFSLGNSYSVEDYRHSITKLTPYREYYGMSTKLAQTQTGGDGNKTSEGISKPVEVKYSVKHFMENVEAYLRSCMSYTNSKSIFDLHKAELVITNDNIYRK